MTYLLKVKPMHFCRLPKVSPRPEGIIWQCDTCERRFLFQVYGSGAGWTYITAREARRLIRRAERSGRRLIETEETE